MPNLFVLLAPLAVYGIVQIVTYTDGPLDVFYRLREFVGYYDVEVDKFFGKLLRCFWCSATWVSLFFTILYFTSRPVFDFLVLWFGCVAVAGIVSNKVNAL